MSFGRDTKSRRSLLSGVYARGSERPQTEGADQNVVKVKKGTLLMGQTPQEPGLNNEPKTLGLGNIQFKFKIRSHLWVYDSTRALWRIGPIKKFSIV